MSILVVFLIFILVFFSFHILSKIFGNICFWQDRNYDFNKVLNSVKKNKKIKRYYPTIFSLIILIILYLLVFVFKFKANILYLAILFGFGYFVYSTLEVFPKILQKKLICPKFTGRSVFIFISTIIISLLPLIIVCFLYSSWLTDTSSGVTEGDGGDSGVVSILPYEDTEKGLFIIPLETAVTVLFFIYLFLVDISIPAIVGMFVGVSGAIARIYINS